MTSVNRPPEQHTQASQNAVYAGALKGLVESAMARIKFRSDQENPTKGADQHRPAVEISVIIPVYNVAPWLETCLDSIVKQSFRDIEIICVDDHSSDGSAAILRTFADRDPRIIHLSHENNLGISKARNTGLNASTGKYLFFVDPDDRLFDHNSLMHLYKVARRRKSDLVIGKTYEWFPDRGRMGDYYPCRKQTKNIHRTTFLSHPELVSHMVVWNKLIKRSFMVKNGILWFDEASRRFEDNSYSWKVFLLASRIALITQPTYLFRQPVEEQNYFASKMYPHLEEQLKVFEKMFDFFNARPEISLKARSIIEGHYMSSLLQLANQQDLWSAMDPTRKAMLLARYADVMERLPATSFEALPLSAKNFYQYYKAGDMDAAFLATQRKKSGGKQSG